MPRQPDRGDRPSLHALRLQRLRIEEQSLASALTDLQTSYDLRTHATYCQRADGQQPNPVLVRHCKLLEAELMALAQELVQLRSAIAEAAGDDPAR